jgi:EAL domain-containing protein (putative c-di-GMP-specific phosphodiesterase class I)
LIKDIQSQEKDRRLVTTLIDLAQRLGYKVVAEGIENQANFNTVRGWGCTEGQGYFIAPPMIVPELMQWLVQDGAAQRFALDENAEDL